MSTTITGTPLEEKAALGDQLSSSSSASSSHPRGQGNAQYGLKFVGAALSSKYVRYRYIAESIDSSYLDMVASGVSNPLDIIKVGASRASTF